MSAPKHIPHHIPPKDFLDIPHETTWSHSLLTVCLLYLVIYLWSQGLFSLNPSKILTNEVQQEYVAIVNHRHIFKRVFFYKNRKIIIF